MPIGIRFTFVGGWIMGSIIVESRSVYGEWKVYPVCELAKHFAAIAGTKTLTHAVLCRIEAMGFVIHDRSAVRV